MDRSQTTGEKVFDYEYDYKYYWGDFLELGINLNKQDISWWEFDSLLEKILLNQNSTISQVLQYRTYKKPSRSMKSVENEEHKFYMEKKRQYALPKEKSVDNNLDKLWGYLERKVGDDLSTTQR